MKLPLFLARLAAPSLRVRLALWTGGLLAACVVLLAVFVNVGTVLTTSSQVAVVMQCGPVSLGTLPRQKLPARCIRQPDLPSTPWIAQQGAALYILQHMRGPTVLGSLTVLMLGMLGVYWLSGRILAPLRTVSKAAQEISVDTIDRRLALARTNDELKSLADAFDGMLDRLAAGLVRERRFASDASHELRTPLAIMRTNLDEIRSNDDATLDEYREMGATMDRALERLERLTGDLLLLARDRPLQVSKISLNAMLDDVTRELGALAESRDVTLRVELANQVIVTGESALLRRAFSNLIENGIRYNHEGGSVRVSASALHGYSQIQVVDSGPGITLSAGEHIFERFYRCDSSRSAHTGGAGLGLALSRDIVRRHGGTLRVAETSSRGTNFEVTLPLSAGGVQMSPPKGTDALDQKAC